MMMSMNEKKILFTFGCPNRGLTVERLRHAAALAVDPAAKKAFYSLAVKLYEDSTDEQYRNFYYNMRLDMEHTSTTTAASAGILVVWAQRGCGRYAPMFPQQTQGPET